MEGNPQQKGSSHEGAEDKFAPPFTVLALGRMGQGKSSLLNVFINRWEPGKEYFSTSTGLKGKTKQIKRCLTEFPFGDSSLGAPEIMAIDIPGWNDDVAESRLLEYIAAGVIEGVDLIAIVMNRTNRMEEQDKEFICQWMAKTFGPEGWRFAALVITGGEEVWEPEDQAEDIKAKAQQWITESVQESPEFRELYELAHHRAVLVGNSKACRRDERNRQHIAEQMLQLCMDNRNNNKGMRYTSSKFEEARKAAVVAQRELREAIRSRPDQTPEEYEKQVAEAEQKYNTRVKEIQDQILVEMEKEDWCLWVKQGVSILGATAAAYLCGNPAVGLAVYRGLDSFGDSFVSLLQRPINERHLALQRMLRDSHELWLRVQKEYEAHQKDKNKFLLT